ncbi:class I SAM-dependent methyltransferase [Leadbetterella byssophila]|uniref:Methyltransferase type 11 n=1 Tax=Leadbetterella byssophila (strain DSM 17132 / JCM 16389 / KACC 11308 / NBRC 106382 / 4M15) TaxID=649349 RepID=E4RR67_LEAB4|nr:methyltransferase domain-containing protein [Leadbetterella byssophila]ADQ17553.1 Methyltransferase type 11 [Leadbetterella byssophila DSM 17132]
MNKKYVQYGCGLSAPEQWINYDASPTLQIQKTPVLGNLLQNQLNTRFPSNVRYGDIIKGLPEDVNSVDGLYCSHTLEHLALADMRKALANSYAILKKGGIFRCVVPDLEYAAREYLRRLDNGDENASHFFMENTLLGVPSRARGAKGMVSSYFGNSHHLWMWDRKSLSAELRNAGFIEVRECSFNDSEDPMFKHVEDPSRFEFAVALEARK